MNPELRQTLHTLSRNIEAANETAQENIYTFSQTYIDPCLTSVKSCFVSCTGPCFSSPERRHRKRAQSRGRAELSFDFYDDWDDEFGDHGDAREGDALLGWGNERLDRLLAGSQQTGRDGRGRKGEPKQPSRQRAMSYGSRRPRQGLPQDSGDNSTVIPGSSYLGFLERLPWGLGRRGLKYQPSAADLQENPGGNWILHDETEPLVEDSDEDESRTQAHQGKQHGRKRSSTNASASTNNSLSSRGDLIPSEDEIEADAVPLDDEFSMVLERRNTGLNPDDRSSGRAWSGKKPSVSRASTRSGSLKSGKSGVTRSNLRQVDGTDEILEADEANIPSIGDLKREEEEARQQEEADIGRRREAAEALARERGLLPDVKEVLLSKYAKLVADEKQDAGQSQPSEQNEVQTTVTPPSPIVENHVIPTDEAKEQAISMVGSEHDADAG